MQRSCADLYTLSRVVSSCAGDAFHTDWIHIALVIKLDLFMLQLTYEKDVGMGLCMFNFVIMLSLYLVSVHSVLPSLHLFTFF